MTNKFGDKFDADLSSFLEWQLWVFGYYEKHLAQLFACLLSPDDRCIDVGANVGIHTVRLAKLVGRRGEVIALEPDKGLARRANNNLLLNGLGNVRLIQAAASARGGGSVLLYRPDAQDSNKGRASLVPHAYLTGSASRVPTVSIDDVNDAPVALIKIDVEGHETAVLSGATRTIETYSPPVVFEYAPELLTTKSLSPFDWLQHRGYRLFIISQERHGVTGRGSLELKGIMSLPETFAEILAIPEQMVPRVSPLLR